MGALAIGVPGATRAATLPTIYVNYTMNCTFSLSLDSGAPVNSIPPGNYQVLVTTPIAFRLANIVNPAPNDFTACKGWAQFQLTGPGVDDFTTLDVGCNPTALLPESYFAPNSTYTAVDNNQPGATRTTFTTLGSGTPAQPAGLGPNSTSASSQGDIVGSALQGTGLKGLVLGTLAANGKLTLTIHGRPVSTLGQGNYKFRISDRDPKAGVMIEPNGGPATWLSGVKFTGTRTTTVMLTNGPWQYSAGGRVVHFLVG
jgi:hypothetical protein